MVDCRDGAGLLLEAGDLLELAGELSLEDLDGDRAPDGELHAAIDGPEAAGPDEGVEAVALLEDLADAGIVVLVRAVAGRIDGLEKPSWGQLRSGVWSRQCGQRRMAY